MLCVKPGISDVACRLNTGLHLNRLAEEVCKQVAGAKETQS